MIRRNINEIKLEVVKTFIKLKQDKSIPEDILVFMKDSALEKVELSKRNKGIK